ncbi:MAG: PAS domain S-box protein [Ignavibacteriaceae bacterium]|nr:PAS domain S-box protein [Ignavibacteriaceae bacterium]
MTQLFMNLKESINNRWNTLIAVNIQDNGNARLGRLFNTLMVISTGIVLLLTIVFLLMIPLGLADHSIVYIAASFPVVIIPLSIYCIIQTKHGRIRSSVTLYVLFHMVAISLAVLLFDGILSPGWILYIWTITIAGTLLTPIYALWMTGGVVVYFFSLFFLTQFGFYQPPLTFGIGREYVETACLLIMLVSTVGLLTFLNMKNLRNTLIDLHKEIAEHTQAELALQYSEEKYRTVADFTYDWEAWLAPDGTYRYMSPSCERITGHTVAEFMSNSNLLIQITHPDDQAKLIEHHRVGAHEAQGEDLGFDFRIITPKDEIRWISHSCTAVYSEDGQWLGRRISNRDITERKQAEEHIAALALRYRTLLQTASDGIHILDSQGNIFEANEAFCKMLGYTHEELLKLNVADWDMQWSREKLSDDMNEFINHPTIFETKHRRKDGTILDVEINNVSVTLEGRNYLYAASRNITERKRTEEEIKQKNEQLVNLNSEKDKFFSIIAHDLKSPFQGFLGLTQIMAEEARSFSADDWTKFGKEMHQTANNLFALLKNLLEWAQMQKGSMSFQPKELSLSDMIAENVETIKRRSEQKGITVINEATGFINAYADEKMINSVLLNLLSNAIKFTKRNGTVTVKANKVAEKMIEISVSDTGVGMQKSVVEKLFKIGEKTGSKGTEGELSTGLGLLLCREFVEKHGGKIWVDSEEGRGSTFYFTMPGNKDNKN